MHDEIRRSTVQLAVLVGSDDVVHVKNGGDNNYEVASCDHGVPGESILTDSIITGESESRRGCTAGEFKLTVDE